nr:reverse transcriptase domain-containing protein [Tanacetum cinerariifolium]
MRTRSSSNLPVVSPPNPSTSNPKHRNHKRSKQPFILEESPIDTMADQRTMEELLRTPTEGYAEAFVFPPPPILAKQFELKHINKKISDVTTAMTAMLKQFQATPPLAPVNAVEEICVTCGGAHLYYQCLAAGGNTFPEFRIISKDTFQQPQAITIRVIPVIVPRVELKYKSLADLGASINLMPLSVWKELGLLKLIPTRMTLELANRSIYTPAGIARDVFVPVGKFTFPADFVIVDYESDPRVPLILGRPFLRTAHALIDVHGEEMILCDSDERLILNMKHDTASYSNQPQRESVNLINIFNVSSEDFLEVSFSNQPSGNPTFSPHQVLTSPEVTHDIHDSEGCNDIRPHFDDSPLSGSTTYFSNLLLEEFTDELALITYPPDYDDNL